MTLINMNHFIFFWFSLLSLTVGSCQNQPKNFSIKTDSIQARSDLIDTSKIAIVDINTDQWLRISFDSLRSYNLSNTDIAIIERVFAKCLIDHHINTLTTHYRRQYVPYIDKNGHKSVWINCFCTDDGMDFSNWKSSIVLVADGGSCFLNLTIDISDASFSNFETNGNG